MKQEDTGLEKIRQCISELEKEKKNLEDEFKKNLDALSKSSFSQNATWDIGELIHVNFGKAMQQYEYIIQNLQWAIGEEEGNPDDEIN